MYNNEKRQSTQSTQSTQRYNINLYGVRQTAPAMKKLRFVYFKSYN